MLLVAVSYYSIVRWYLPLKIYRNFREMLLLGKGAGKFPSLKSEVRH